MYCPNQCAGRGVCVYGFCKCEKGWHGTDCSVPTIAKLKDVTETPPEKGEWHTGAVQGLAVLPRCAAVPCRHSDGVQSSVLRAQWPGFFGPSSSLPLCPSHIAHSSRPWLTPLTGSAACRPTACS
jgi:hypothetical protein